MQAKNVKETLSDLHWGCLPFSSRKGQVSMRTTLRGHELCYSIQSNFFSASELSLPHPTSLFMVRSTQHSRHDTATVLAPTSAPTAKPPPVAIFLFFPCRLYRGARNSPCMLSRLTLNFRVSKETTTIINKKIK